jgi:hypothetical protein
VDLANSFVHFGVLNRFVHFGSFSRVLSYLRVFCSFWYTLVVMKCHLYFFEYITSILSGTLLHLRRGSF